MGNEEHTRKVLQIILGNFKNAKITIPYTIRD